jgi:hypothetical protein
MTVPLETHRSHFSPRYAADSCLDTSIVALVAIYNLLYLQNYTTRKVITKMKRKIFT